MEEQSGSPRIVAIILVVAVVAGIVAFALLQKPPAAPPAPIAVSASPASTPAGTPTPFPAAAPAVAAVPSPPPRVPVTMPPAWEGTIDSILRLNISQSQMAHLLINLLPTLPEDGQVEAAHHIANLLPDSEYTSVRPLLLNASLPESVLSVFFTDLMNRDDPTKLDAFLDIAQVPNHPFQSEAMSDLQIYVGQNYGNDWPKWQSAVTAYLKTAKAQ